MGDSSSFEVIVVGAGAAGLTCAAYLTGAGIRTLVCEKEGKTGGLVGTFTSNGVTFDAGIRAFENSGIIFPMLRQLRIELDFVRNPVSIGIGSDMKALTPENGLLDYQEMLCCAFPGEREAIGKIIREIKKVQGYMDVLYGIDNPLFIDYKGDREYLLKTLLPWLLKYQVNIRKAKKLDEPVNRYLRRFTDNQPLIDIITQHFFKNTPTFFALSYFGLYLDYSYPVGGTGVLAKKLEERIKGNGGEILTNTQICAIDPVRREVTTADGRKYGYRKLVWAADMRALYSALDDLAFDVEKIRNRRQRSKILAQRKRTDQSLGGDSILTLFLSIELEKEYFSGICGAHTFYTPETSGLNSLGDWREAIRGESGAIRGGPDAAEEKARLQNWLSAYIHRTTFEISIPTLRDESLAPEGKTGVIISTLMDHALVKRIADAGWYEEFKQECQHLIIETVEPSLCPGITGKISEAFVSTPLTIERLSGNTGGAITGWAFAGRDVTGANPIGRSIFRRGMRNGSLPSENRFQKVTQSIFTPIPDIYQAGQWTFSPSGLPISILTGKLAAEAVKKTLGQ